MPLLFEMTPAAEENLASGGRSDRKEYSAEWLFKYRRPTYDAILQALGEGFGVRQICRALRVSHHTIEAVREREPQLVATLKKETVRQLRRVVRVASDRLEDEIDKVPLQSLPIVIGILTEKAQLLDGEATARIEERKVVTHADYEEMVKTLEADVTVVETGFGGEKKSPKELTLALPAPAEPVLGDPGKPDSAPLQDKQSFDYQSKIDAATVSAPVAPENPPAQTGGAGGVPPGAGGG